MFRKAKITILGDYMDIVEKIIVRKSNEEDIINLLLINLQFQ